MKRIYIFAITAGLALTPFAVATAAKKKSNKQSLRIPTQAAVIPASATRYKVLSVPKLPPPQVPSSQVVAPPIAPVPADPIGQAYRPPVAPEILEPIPNLSELPPSPAYRPLLPPVVGSQLPVLPPPVVEPDYIPVAAAPTIPLFKRVRYVGKRKQAPDAVTKLIVIKDPTQRRAAAADDCERFVAIEICVPACECEKITPNKTGNRIRYNYGEYGAEVRIKNGRVVVAYHQKR